MRVYLLLFLLLIGCGDTALTYNATSQQECEARCGTYMARHWCSSANVNYTQITTRQPGELVLLQPLKKEIILEQHCGCIARSCWW